jgi:hypothetical protein
MYRDLEGRVCSLPSAWTTACAPDPYVALSAGRSLLRVPDLVALRETVCTLLSVRPGEEEDETECKANCADNVKEIVP